MRQLRLQKVVPFCREKATLSKYGRLLSTNRNRNCRPLVMAGAFFMQQQELIPHLFRTEFSKIAAVLCKTFGIAHIEAAEDIAGETFAAALETWPHKGVPENPVAWLYAVAKNKTKNQLQRNQIFSKKIVPEIKYSSTPDLPEIEIDLSEKNISDSQLQMLFAICHPSIPP